MRGTGAAAAAAARSAVFPVCLFWIYLSFTPNTATSSGILKCNESQSLLAGRRCCSKCPPGDGVIEQCTLDNDTLCAPCIHGNSFSASHSSSEPCARCSLCPDHGRLVTPCNLTHDAVCDCERGYFYDGLVGQCVSCDQCHVGFGVKKPCSRLHNTVCVKCPEGSYSDHKSYTGCVKCSACATSEVILQPCTPVQNTICIEIPYLASDQSAAEVTQSSSGKKTREKSTPDIIPILCLVLGLVVAGTVVWVIVKTRRQRKKTSSQLKMAPVTCSSAAKHGDDQTQCLLRGTRRNETRFPHLLSPTKMTAIGPDSLPVTNITRYETLPLVRRFAVENLLQHSPEATTLLRLLATELVETYPATDDSLQFRHLLSNWSKRKTSTVGVLAQALTRVGREDVLEVLFHPLSSDCFKNNVAVPEVL